MRRLINIVESTQDVILYHGTLRDNVDGITERGLEAQIGAMVSHFYDETDDLENLVFAADTNSLRKCANSIGHQLWVKTGDRTYGYSSDGMREHGALCVIEADASVFDHVDDDAIHYGRAPSSAEPGDYYSRDDVIVDRILTGDELVNFFSSHGVTLRSSVREGAERGLPPHGSSPFWITALAPLTAELKRENMRNWSWVTGGCFAFAEAFHEAFGGEFWGICSDPDGYDEYGVEHAMVKVNGAFYDFNGTVDVETYMNKLTAKMGRQMALLPRTDERVFWFEDEYLDDEQMALLRKVLSGNV